MTLPLVFFKEDWRHGLRCMDCNHSFEEHEVYSKRLVGMTDEDTSILEIVCVLCAYGIKT